MALGQAEEDIEALRHRLLKVTGQNYYIQENKIFVLEGLWRLLERGEVSNYLYQDAIGELLFKKIGIDEINLYAGLT